MHAARTAALKCRIAFTTKKTSARWSETIRVLFGSKRQQRQPTNKLQVAYCTEHYAQTFRRCKCCIRNAIAILFTTYGQIIIHFRWTIRVASRVMWKCRVCGAMKRDSGQRRMQGMKRDSARHFTHELKEWNEIGYFLLCVNFSRAQ